MRPIPRVLSLLMPVLALVALGDHAIVASEHHTLSLVVPLLAGELAIDLWAGVITIWYQHVPGFATRLALLPKPGSWIALPVTGMAGFWATSVVIRPWRWRNA